MSLLLGPIHPYLPSCVFPSHIERDDDDSPPHLSPFAVCVTHIYISNFIQNEVTSNNRGVLGVRCEVLGSRIFFPTLFNISIDSLRASGGGYGGWAVVVVVGGVLIYRKYEERELCMYNIYGTNQSTRIFIT